MKLKTLFLVPALALALGFSGCSPKDNADSTDASGKKKLKLAFVVNNAAELVSKALEMGFLVNLN